MERDELLTRIQEGKAELDRAFAAIPADRMETFLSERDRDRTPAEALQGPFRPHLPDRMLLDTVLGNTSEHYAEHVPMLRAAAGG